MTAFLFLQVFEAGVPVPMPLQPLMDVLSRYGKPGRGLGDGEIALPADTIAACCTVVGDGESGISCVGFDRPRFDADLRRLVWECMTRFGCAVFDDTLDTVCTTLDRRSTLPRALAAASVCDVRPISSEQQLWTDEFEFTTGGVDRPALIYKNAHLGGPNFQMFDHADFDQKHVYIELGIVPAACNAGTLRVVSNLELRVDAAIAANPEYALFYRYAVAESSLLAMKSAPLGKCTSGATIISPPPWEEAVSPRFVADRGIFSSEHVQAAKLTQQAHETYQLTLDGSAGSVDTLAKLLDTLHTDYVHARNAAPQPFSSKVAVGWAMTAGGYLGTLIRQQIGAQWGYLTRGQQRLPVVRTHRGRLCNPHLLVLDHIINGPRSSVADYFHQLRQTGMSASPRSEDAVSDIPGFCDILLGKSHFQGEGGALPLQARIPRDRLDFSVSSLHALDAYLAEVAHQRVTIPNQSLANLMGVAGAYLGEVIRSRTTEANYWQWATYDDVARDQPDFKQKRLREDHFFAILDSTQQMAYPLAQVAALLGGADTESTHAYARRLVCVRRGELAGTVLDEIDVQPGLRSLPADQRDYPKITAPYWLGSDPLVKLFQSYPGLLAQGRLVWAHMVQANMGIFDSGDSGLPGEVVYDPQGILSPQELAPIAQTLFGLRKREAQLDANDPEQAQLLAIAKHLNAETTRAFGMAVPRQLCVEPLQLSTVFFERKHLPDGRLVLPYFPILISDKHPGCAMVLPARWWPQKLLNRVAQILDAKQVEAWNVAWKKLAEGRSADDEANFQHRINALEKYAASGGDGQQAVDLVFYGMLPFQATTQPPPFEWEWDLPLELRSYAECLLTEVESDRACRLPLLAASAQQAFAARYLGQMINLHSLLLCGKRGLATEKLKIDADEIQYAALGLAAGCEEAALRSARLLCGAWQSLDAYQDLMRPEVRAVFVLFARHLGLQLPELTPFKSTPHLDALIDNDCWRRVHGDELCTLLEQACAEHTHSAPRGPFQGLPAALLMILKLRQMEGLANPTLTHPLLATALEFPGTVSFDAACGDLLSRVRGRMTRNGFQEESIVRAMVTKAPLVVADSGVGAMPLRPDLYPAPFQVNAASVKSPRTPRTPQAAQAQQADRVVDGLGAVMGFLPRVLTWLLLLYGAKAMLGQFAQISGLVPPTLRVYYTVWIVVPFVVLALLSLRSARSFMRDSALLVAALLLTFFGYGVYSMHVSRFSDLSDIRTFLWVPVAQMGWVAGWTYVTLWRKNAKRLD